LTKTEHPEDTVITKIMSKTIFFIDHIDFFHLSEFQHASHDVFAGLAEGTQILTTTAGGLGRGASPSPFRKSGQFTNDRTFRRNGSDEEICRIVGTCRNMGDVYASVVAQIDSA
jgi:hypothetical protein